MLGSWVHSMLEEDTPPQLADRLLDPAGLLLDDEGASGSGSVSMLPSASGHSPGSLDALPRMSGRRRRSSDTSSDGQDDFLSPTGDPPCRCP